MKLSDYGTESGYDLDDIRELLDYPTMFSSMYPGVIKMLCDEINSLREQLIADELPAKPKVELVTANRRFVHKRTTPRKGNGLAWNSDCHCQPRYYRSSSLTVITEEEASKMHRCRKCFKDE